LKPVLVNIEEGWQIGYLLESLQTGWVVVFVPHAPTPMSGNVMYLPEGCVRPLSVSMVEAMSLVKHMGIGSSKALATADLALPKAVQINLGSRSGLPVEASRFLTGIDLDQFVWPDCPIEAWVQGI
jgi:hypothetical protein